MEKKGRILGITGAILAIVGVFLPWIRIKATLPPPPKEETFLGFNCIVGTGIFGIGIVLTLILAIVSLVIIAKKKYLVSTITGILTLIFSIIAIGGMYNFKAWAEGKGSFLGFTALTLEPLYGGFVCLIGAIVLLVGAIIGFKGKKALRAAPAPPAPTPPAP